MSNVAPLIPRPGNDPLSNLNELIHFSKKHSPFKSKEGWNWDSLHWDVKNICLSQGRKAGYRVFLNFNRDNKKGNNVKDSRSDMAPFRHKC